MGVEPFRHIGVAGAFLHFRLEVVTFHAFETEKHVIERTIEMIFADVSGDERATLIQRAPKNCITADARAWTARRFLCQIFTRDFVFHVRG